MAKIFLLQSGKIRDDRNAFTMNAKFLAELDGLFTIGMPVVLKEKSRTAFVVGVVLVIDGETAEMRVYLSTETDGQVAMEIENGEPVFRLFIEPARRNLSVV